MTSWRKKNTLLSYGFWTHLHARLRCGATRRRVKGSVYGQLLGLSVRWQRERAEKPSSKKADLVLLDAVDIAVVVDVDIVAVSRRNRRAAPLSAGPELAGLPAGRPPTMA